MSYGICSLVYVSRSACEDVKSCFQDAQGSVWNEHYEARDVTVVVKMLFISRTVECYYIAMKRQDDTGIDRDVQEKPVLEFLT